MDKIIQINRASEFLFLTVGSAYLFAFLSWKNNFHPFFSEIFLRLADTPFALFAIMFGVTSFSLSLHNQYSDPRNTSMSKFDKLLLVVGVGIFLLVAIIDIAIPSAAPIPLFT